MRFHQRLIRAFPSLRLRKFDIASSLAQAQPEPPRCPRHTALFAIYSMEAHILGQQPPPFEINAYGAAVKEFLLSLGEVIEAATDSIAPFITPMAFMSDMARSETPPDSSSPSPARLVTAIAPSSERPHLSFTFSREARRWIPDRQLIAGQMLQDLDRPVTQYPTGFLHAPTTARSLSLLYKAMLMSPRGLQEDLESELRPPGSNTHAACGIDGWLELFDGLGDESDDLTDAQLRFVIHGEYRGKLQVLDLLKSRQDLSIDQWTCSKDIDSISITAHEIPFTSSVQWYPFPNRGRGIRVDNSLQVRHKNKLWRLSQSLYFYRLGFKHAHSPRSPQQRVLHLWRP